MIFFSFLGQAVGGIFPALVDVFVTLVRVEEQDVGFACFAIATVVLVVKPLNRLPVVL
jgi:hypothetical protein